MGLSTRLYLILLAAAGLGRLVELRISRRHQRMLARRGILAVKEPYFRWMVMVHAGVFAGSAIEVILLKRRPIRPLAIAMGAAFALANALRWWVIQTLGEHWNVGVMHSVQLGVVTEGPFRWLRHPNYLAVIVELEALPLLHTAWLTAILGGLAHAWVLSRRIRTEESLLMSRPEYRAAMGSKPRFIPRIGD